MEWTRQAVVLVVLAAACAFGTTTQLLRDAREGGREQDGPRSALERDRAIAEDDVRAVLAAYVDALAAARPGDACEQLADPEQQEIVAWRTGSSVRSANARDCPDFILERSIATPLLDPSLPVTDVDSAEVDVNGDPNHPDWARIELHGDPDLELEARLDGSAWRLDTRSQRRAIFSASACATRFSAPACGCVFDRLRTGNPDFPAKFEHHLEVALSGRPSPLLVNALRSCVGPDRPFDA